MCLVDIIQNMWRTGEIPQDLGWTFLVIIKNRTSHTRGIGLLDTLWKVLKALIDTRLRSSLHIYDVLHGFRARRGTETDIMELNIVQDIGSIDQEPLFLVFLDLRKSNDTLDWGCLLITPEGYGEGPCLCGISETLWDCQQVVPRYNGFYRPSFSTTRGTTQGGLVSLMSFNVVVDNVIVTWLDMKV